MYRPRVIPCLLLKDKGLVKTIKFKDPTYVGDPINAVKIFNDAKADELVFLDITATQENRITDIEVIRNIGEEAFMPFAVGGGINNLEHVMQLISAGAEKVVINTAAVNNPSLLTEASKIYGRQSIIASIDVKREGGAFAVYTHSGGVKSPMNAMEAAQAAEEAGAGEIMINSIDRDGTQEGYDIELVKLISDSVNIPVIAVGGAGDFDHFADAVHNGGASAVAAGSLFVFIGRKRAVLINYPDSDELQEMFTDE
ncbi:MAG TPA: glycosyl amidation-associated protein WbuZ [Flavobacteriales bacterium]|nr:glycosyl amidation-associated protein WbuZ [Flavobacteriales bacterium]HIO68754.1 glycosyl amidation-associated protein WbuZ [Flavobacteriales bacterium]